MTREEILEKSRRENQVMDEREQQGQAKGGSIAGRVSVALGIFFSFLNETMNGPKMVHHIVWLLVACNFVITYGYQAYHLKKRSYWIYTAFFAACAVFYIYLILETFLAGGI